MTAVEHVTALHAAPGWFVDYHADGAIWVRDARPDGIEPARVEDFDEAVAVARESAA